MKIRLSWYLFYGHMMNMTRQETLVTRLGEMNDLIACLAIYNGTAHEKGDPLQSFERALQMR